MAKHETDTGATWLRRIRSSKWFIYVVVNLAIFTDIYLYGLIIPVLPFALTEYVHISPNDVQKWIGILLGAFGAGLLIGSPVAGYLADRGTSRRKPYLLGLIALAASIVMFAIGKSLPVFFIARFIQGLSGGFVHSIGTAILADTVGPNSIAQAMGFIALTVAAAMAAGPVIGGLLYHRFGYQAVFMSAYTLIAIDVLFRILMVERKTVVKELPSVFEEPSMVEYTAAEDYGTVNVGQPPQDRQGEHAPLLKSGISEHNPSLLSPESIAQSPKASDPSTPSPRRPRFISRHSASMLSTKSNTENIKPPPSIPTPNSTSAPIRARRPTFITILTTPRILVAILGSVMEAFMLTELESVLPLYIKRLFNFNSSQVGIVWLFVMLAHFSAPFVGILSDRVGAASTVTVGYLLAVPLWILLRLIDHDTPDQVLLLCLLLGGLGFALNLILTPVFSDAKLAVDDIETKDPGVFGERGAYAMVYALMNMAYAAGSLLGPLVGSVLVDRIGWARCNLFMGVVCAVCAWPSWVALGGRVKDEGGREDGV